MRTCLILLALFWFGASALRARAAHLEIDGLAGRVIIENVIDAEPDELYPVVFYFHGTGGSASLSLLKEYTKGLKCILVGMSYEKAGLLQMDGGQVEKEFRSFRKVVGRLEQEYPVDPKRLYVSGFSKGGWMAAFLIESQPDLAGAVVLGAGALSRMPLYSETAAKGKLVYIGIGVEESNQVNSARLSRRLGRLGAKVTLDQWDTTGHRMPSGGAVALHQWFQRELGNVTREEARSWARKRFKEIKSEEDLRRRALALIRMKEYPFLKMLGRKGTEIVEREIQRFKRQSKLGGLEIEAWERFDSLVKRELQSRKVSDLESYLRGHQAGKKRYAKTITAGAFRAAEARLQKVLAQ